MKNQIEIIKCIASLNDQDQHATPVRIHKRTLMRYEAIMTALKKLEASALIEFEGGEIWLTQSGWDAFHREAPRHVDPSLLLSHCNES